MIVARNLLLCFALSVNAAAATFSITSGADSGPGTLRQAILDANSGACASPCAITYGSVPGVLTVSPLTPLPNMDASNVSIASAPPYRAWSLEIRGDNVTSGSGLHVRGSHVTISGIIVNGFPGSGIVVEGSSIQVDDCIIGLDPTGTQPIPNKQNGIAVDGGQTVEIGSNTIGGNGGNGIFARNASQLFIGLNYIGKQYLPQGSGNIALGNGATGVFLQDVHGAHFLRNSIVNNGLDGIATAGQCSGIVMEGLDLPSLIYDNGLMPIDLGFDGVTGSGRPVLTTADISNGFMRVIGHAGAPATINVFASDRMNQFGIADAETFLYAANVAGGDFEFRFKLPADVTGQWISATSTTDTTSELSDPLRAASNDQNYTVSTTSAAGPGSLAQAIADANAGICSENFPCRIVFPFPGSARATIAQHAPLPPITRSGIIVDGGNLVEIDGSGSPPGPGLTISSANGQLFGNAVVNLRITNFNGPGILIDATTNPIFNPVISRNTIDSNRGDGILVRGNVPFTHFGTYGSGNRIQFNTITNNGGNGVTMEGGFFEFDTNTIRSNAIGVDIRAGAQGHLESNTISLNRDAGLSIATAVSSAFKASIVNPIFSNGGKAIRQQPTVQEPPVLTSATYDPATQQTTVTVAFVKGAPQNWTTVIDLYASRYPEMSGGSGEKALGSFTANSSQMTFTLNRSDLRGMRIAGTATPFIYQGFKGTPEPNLFGQGFEYGTTSEFSRAIPVTTKGCASDAPQISGWSADELRWTTVPGATSYNVWVRKVPGAPVVIGNTSSDRFSISLDPGSYEWFVEALFPNCPSVMSEAASLSVTRKRVVEH